MLYSRLAECFGALEATPAKLGKTELISELLEEAGEGDLYKVVTLLQGRVFPPWSDKEIGIAVQLMIKVISSTLGIGAGQVENTFKKTGDLGLVAEEFMGKKRQATLAQKKLTVEKVFENLQKIADVEGKGAQERKIGLVSELISGASPKEAKYIVRTVIGDLRVGVAEGMVRDAIARAYFSDIVWDEKKIIELMGAKEKIFLIEKGLLEKLEEKNKISKKELSGFKQKNKFIEKDLEQIKKTELWKEKNKTDFIILSYPDAGSEMKKRIVSAVEWAWFLRPDFGEVAEIAKKEGLEALERTPLKTGEPYIVLLAEKSPSLEAALGEYENPALEFKYDGARVCIHKKGEKVWLYTRRLENITRQFPEVVKWAMECVKAREAIVEGEMLGFSRGNPMPFQFLSQRIKRKYDIEKMAREIPVQVNIFDIVLLEGKSLLKALLRERWEILRKTVNPLQGKFQLAKHIETKDLKKAEAFYKEALEAHQEGIIVKNMDAAYQPGRRVGFWLKVKPVLETLDLAIIGATWGTGKRAGWLGSLVLGCMGEGGRFLECGMIGTGIKEKGDSGVTFEELTRLLKPNITEEKGSEVKIRPRVVVEVEYEEIQKSPTYASGYALRFPRVKSVRYDKRPEDSDSLERIEKIYGMQKGKKG